MNKTHLLPSALPIEDTTLGAIILAPEQAFELMGEAWTPDAFYSSKNQIIANALNQMRREDVKIDLVTIIPYLQKSGAWKTEWTQLNEAAFFLISLTNTVASSANVGYHMKILREKYLARQILEQINKIQMRVISGDDAFAILDDLTSKAELLQTQSSDLSEIQHISEVKILPDIVHAHNNPGKTGIPTGFDDMDRLTGGWQDGELTILGARPGMGKTALALGFALSAAKAGYGAGVITLEMTNKQLKRRLAAMESLVSSTKMKTGATTMDDLTKIEEKINELDKLPIELQQSAYSKSQIKNSIRLLAKKGCKIVFIDYAQQMKEDANSKAANRNLEIESIILMIQKSVKEFNMPIVVLSQLGRPPKGMAVKRPQLSDLKDSGSLEQCANVVQFIHRPDYYEENPRDENGKCMKGIAEVITAKNRDGAVGIIDTRFYGPYTLFKGINEPIIEIPEEDKPDANLRTNIDTEEHDTPF